MRDPKNTLYLVQPACDKFSLPAPKTGEVSEHFRHCVNIIPEELGGKGPFSFWKCSDCSRAVWALEGRVEGLVPAGPACL